MGERSPFERREVTSRRGGPAKEPLSRDAIVAEALRQLSREGLEGMSLRKIAAALETGPASFYAYVDDLSALRALVLDRALATVDVRGSMRHAWRERLVRLLGSYLRVLSQTPGLAQLAMTTTAVGPNALRIIDTLLGLLDEGGVDRGTSAWASDMMLLYVTAIAAEHSGGLDPANPAGAVARAIGTVSKHDYPRVHASREELLSGDGDERFTWGLEVLVRGVLQTARAPGPPVAEKTSKTPRTSKRSSPSR